MKKINNRIFNEFIQNETARLNTQRIDYVKSITFTQLFDGNPYLFLTQNLSSAGKLIINLIHEKIFIFEQELLENFLVDLAIFIASQTCDGYRSVFPGIDLEFINKNTHYVVSIKSGINLGASNEDVKLIENFQNIEKRLKHSQHEKNVQPVLGICYGKTWTSYLREYMKVVGQNFWYLISENRDLYTDIVESLKYRIDESEEFCQEKANRTNLFTKEFIERFCLQNWTIDWKRLVEFYSGNFDLNKYVFE